MARLKKLNSESILKANGRAAGLSSIDAALDLGNGQTLVAYNAKIQETIQKQTAYNAALSTVDELKNQFDALEKELDDLSDRMLTGVATKFGKNSDEYEKAGGTKKSERKRPARKSAVA
ncbi:hypothetical protein FEM03_16440 [Phragmitibacter flavus]|uniref:Uncharacterized protein n=1 Tax=Phragmitibacter flavus TaxID=2576071 RepID=A0A5R8KB55_9BACT|nr:hypothetical protein [Phragmitibacter flavus]TLD69548.1 hypothetical protein FEM03_16440 [Phragmitibacter flavus]